MMQTASVIRFEKAVANLDFELACNELLSILTQVDSSFGGFKDVECDYPPQLDGMYEDQMMHFCNRVATAVTQLFDAKNSFSLSDEGFQRFMTLHRWLDIIFASSTYINADHILQTFNTNPSDEPNAVLHLSGDLNVWRKFCILYTMESNIPLDLDVLWGLNRDLCASLCFALQSSRFIGTDVAFGKRAAILKWFPAKLREFENLNTLPSGIAHDVYMHCSYDVSSDKHLIKKSLNEVIRRHILAVGMTDRDVSNIGRINDKPVMFVVLEHFNTAHAIYRTHSTSMIAAREHFHLVGFGSDAVDEVGRAVFDEFHLTNHPAILEKLKFIMNMADQMQPAVLYMPSIGMDLTSILLSNLRIAPIQSIALGHPATTHSPFIDYVVVEDDYVGSEDCFSEELIRLPKDALPYVPSALTPENVDYRLRENPEVVHIGVAATTMKMNPHFLEACQAIRDRSSVPVHFHFAMGQCSGVSYPYIRRFIKSYLGDDASVYSHRVYNDYLAILHKCDLLINPFPFGNTNGIIDMVTLGLIGVCKTGPEVHEHIDEGLFARLGLPLNKLVAKTAEDYVAKTLYLIENHAERLELRRHVIENNGLSTLFTGNPKPMGEAFMVKLIEKGIIPKPKRVRKTTKSTTSKSAPKATASKATASKAAKIAKKTDDSTEKPKSTRRTTKKPPKAE